VIRPRVPLARAIPDYLVEIFLALAPHDALSCRIKASLLRWRGAQIGTGLKTWRDIMIDDYRKLRIGDNVAISRSSMFVTLGGVTIGNDVIISFGCQILSAGHRIPPVGESIRTSGIEIAPVVIEDGVWICAGAIVLPGVTVGAGSVVAAGAVVNRDFPPYSIVGGAPARLIRRREGA
jgi:acetyltransferase-like isoleucine patch superfamily enzyme